MSNNPFMHGRRFEIEIAMKSVAKQIPRKPTLLPIGFESKECGAIRSVMCITCKEPFMQDTSIKYCPFCGQAIDWSYYR